MLNEIELNLFSKKPAAFNTKTLLLLRLDSIGDYVLFRNFMSEIKRSDKYRDYKITLCGNIWWKNLAEKLDKDVVDRFIWVDYKKMSGSIYRMWIYFRIYRRKFELLIHPTFSRDVVSDELVAHSGANYKIGYESNFVNLTIAQKQQYDKNYSMLIAPRILYEFEFYRNKYFFETLLGKPIDLKAPSIKIGLNEENCIILCPGAKHAFRRWSPTNFAGLAERLKRDFPNDEFVICGSGEDRQAADDIISKSQIEFKNLTGSLSIAALIGIFSSARLIVTNDSGPFHIAVALEKKAVCISNGNNYGRFTPYPTEMCTNSLTIYPDELLKIHSENQRLDLYSKEGSSLDINSIGFEQVFTAIKKKFFL